MHRQIPCERFQWAGVIMAKSHLRIRRRKMIHDYALYYSQESCIQNGFHDTAYYELKSSHSKYIISREDSNQNLRRVSGDDVTFFISLSVSVLLSSCESVDANNVSLIPPARCSTHSIHSKNLFTCAERPIFKVSAVQLTYGPV